MKKLTLMITALLFCALAAQAAMDDRTFTVYVTNTTSTAQTYTLRGELEAVVVDCPAEWGRTGTVAVTSEAGTLFSKAALVDDACFFPRVPLQTYAGATTVGYTYTNTTSVLSSPFYGKWPMAGAVTVTVTGASTSNGTYNVKLIYSK